MYKVNIPAFVFFFIVFVCSSVYLDLTEVDTCRIALMYV